MAEKWKYCAEQALHLSDWAATPQIRVLQALCLIMNYQDGKCAYPAVGNTGAPDIESMHEKKMGSTFYHLTYRSISFLYLAFFGHSHSTVRFLEFLQLHSISGKRCTERSGSAIIES